MRTRDDRVWSIIDDSPASTARDVSTRMGLSQAATHSSLSRLVSAGRIWRARTYPATWYISEPETATVEVLARDVRIIVSMLQAMLDEGRAGPPTEALVDRLQALRTRD